MSIDLKALLRRAQGMPVDSTPKRNDIDRAGLARTTHTREEQMAQIMTVQIEKLEEIASEINLLRSGFGHIDTKVDKVQTELNMLQARRGNDASLPQTELGVQTQSSEDKTMADEGGESSDSEESSDSDESEDESRGERIDDTAAYVHTDHVSLFNFKQADIDKSLKEINTTRKKYNLTRCRHENSKIRPILNERMEIPTGFPRTLSALHYKTPGENYVSQILPRL